MAHHHAVAACSLHAAPCSGALSLLTARHPRGRGGGGGGRTRRVVAASQKDLGNHREEKDDDDGTAMTGEHRATCAAGRRRTVLVAGTVGFALTPLLSPRWCDSEAATPAVPETADAFDDEILAQTTTTTTATAEDEDEVPQQKKKKKKTVLVLGATGRVGSAATRALLRRGHDVRAVVRSKDSIPVDLTSYLRDDAAAAVLTAVEANVLDLGVEGMADAVRGCDAVVSCLGHRLTFDGVYGKVNHSPLYKPSHLPFTFGSCSILSHEL